MSAQQFHDEVMSELQMMQSQLDEYNRLFPMDREIAEFAASNEEDESE